MGKGDFSSKIDLGVLGGMGPRATSYFIDVLLGFIEDIHHPTKDQEYPSLLVRYASYLPDRSESLERNEVEKLSALMEAELASLVQQGCPAIAITCISAFMVAGRITNKYPIINTPKLVREYVARLEKGARIGVLSTTGSRKTGVTSEFVDEDHELVQLTDDEQTDLMKIVYGGAKTWKRADANNGLLDLAALLRKRDCNYIVAGCTEVEMCLAKENGAEKDFIFPLRLTTMDFASKWKGRKPT